MIYRGSKDGFKSSVFHKLCDGKYPTLTLIKSEFDKVFGGFTITPWSSSPKFIADDKAFIFSLTYKTKHTPYQNHQQSVIHDKQYLAAFGGDL